MTGARGRGSPVGARRCGAAGFDELMPTTLATAGVDRLLHHAHVILTQGDSPPQGATTGKGVTPLTQPLPGEN